MEYIGNMGAFARNYSINCSFTNSLESMNRLLSFCVFVNCQCQCRYFCHNDAGSFWKSSLYNIVCFCIRIIFIKFCPCGSKIFGNITNTRFPAACSLSRPHAYRKAGAVSSHILVQKISVIRPVCVHNTDRYIVRGTCLVDTLDLSV